LKGTARNRTSRDNGDVARIGYTRLYATVSGALLVLVGLAGMLENAEFAEPELWSELLGFYAVNGWANALHIVLGLLALLLAPALSRLWAIVAAIAFLFLGIWGVTAPNGELLFGVLPATRAVNLLNLLLGATALIALLASRWDRISAALGTWSRRIGERRADRRRRRKIKQRRRRAGSAPGGSGRTGTRRAGVSKTGS
jgi:hypothetical protein